MNLEQLQSTVSALASGAINPQAAAEQGAAPPPVAAADGPPPIKNVVIILAPDEHLQRLVERFLKPDLERVKVKVTVIGDGINPVTDEMVKDGMAAIKEPTTLMLATHGIEDLGSWRIGLGRPEPSYVEDSIFERVSEKVKGLCLVGCNAEAAFGKDDDGKLFIDRLPKGTEVRAFSTADDITNILDLAMFSDTIRWGPAGNKGDFSVKHMWRDFVSTDLDHIDLKFDEKDIDAVPSKVGISGQGVVDIRDQMKMLKGVTLDDARLKVIYDTIAGDFSKITPEQLKEAAKAVTDGKVDKSTEKLAIILTDVEMELRAREQEVTIKKIFENPFQSLPLALPLGVKPETKER